MRHLILFLTASIVLPCLANAQDPIKIKEIGLTTVDLNSFGITYRFGNEKELWRFNAISTSFGQQNVSSENRNSTNSSFDLSVQAGKEWRKSLHEKFEIRYGFDLGLFYGFSKDEGYDKDTPDEIVESNTNRYGTGINAVLGFNFLLTKEFLLGGEIQPGFFYRYSEQELITPESEGSLTNIRESFGFNISSNSLRLSLVYRF